MARLTQSEVVDPNAPSLTNASPKEVLDARARKLAVRPQEPVSRLPSLEVATFTLSGERYAIETAYVREIAPLHDFTPLPGAPPVLFGVLNLRGEILAIFDLRKIFGVAARGLTDLYRVVVLGRERAEFGLLSDATHEVTTVRTDELFHDPTGTVASGRSCIRGVTNDALIVLDGAKLLADERFVVDVGGPSSRRSTFQT